MNNKLSQDEANVLNEQLALQACFLRATVAKLTGENVPAPKLPNDVLAAIEVQQGHVATLQAKISGTPQTPEPRQAAAEGYSGKARAAKSSNATEQVLAVKGCKSVAELASKRNLNARNYSLPRRS